MEIADLKLGTRASNVLRKNNIWTIPELLALTEHDLYVMVNCGELTIKEIKDKLSNFGMYLKE